MKKRTLDCVACFVIVMGILAPIGSLSLGPLNNHLENTLDNENRDMFRERNQGIKIFAEALNNDVSLIQSATQNINGYVSEHRDYVEDDSYFPSHPAALDRSMQERMENNLKEIRKGIEDNGGQWHATYHLSVLPFLNKEKNELGLIKENISEYQTVTFNGTPPDIFDWRNASKTDWTTPIKNQNGCGSCTAFGTIGALESVIQIQMGIPFLCDLSEAHLFIFAGGDCRKGMAITDALHYLKVFGVTDELCYPYSSLKTGNKEIPQNWMERTVKVNQVQAVSPVFDSIKNSLLLYGPLITGLDVYEDFYAYDGGIYSHVWGDFCGHHCVTIVGYNNEEGYWICKNSWGDQWGEDGWFRIRYGQCDIGDPTYYISSISGNIHPFPPKNPEPSPNARDIDCTATLCWTCSDPDDDRVYYDIYLTEGLEIENEDLIQSHHEYPSFPIANLTRNTIYSWKVIAEDEHGSRYEGDTWRFSTVEDIPPIVKITVPQNGYLNWGKMKIPTPFLIPIIIGEIEVQGIAQDTSGIKKVCFYVNDIQKDTVIQQPYQWKWEEHSWGLELFTLRMTAYDMVGNSASDEIVVRILNP